MLNSGLDRPGTASVVTSGDPGVYHGLDRQASLNESERPFTALYRSLHAGGAEDGVGTTQWTYVRGIEFPLAELADPKFAGKLSDAVREYFATCPRKLDPQAPSDVVISGVLAPGQIARLILTRVDWTTEVGPGPNQSATARLQDVRVRVFGASVTLGDGRPLNLHVQLLYEPAQGQNGKFVFSRILPGIRTDLVSKDCATPSLNAPALDLGGSGWFAREGVFNLSVTLEER